MSGELVAPHGGALCDLLLKGDELKQAIKESIDLESLSLSPRQLCDLELLLNGGFSPLRGFLAREDYEGVVEKMRLANGTLWPMPICLDVDKSKSEKFKEGQKLALRDDEGHLLAVLLIEDKWEPDKLLEAVKVLGTQSMDHPGVAALIQQSGSVYLGGSLSGVALPHHYDYSMLRHGPKELRTSFQKMGWNRIVAFQTRNPMHRAHRELTVRAAEEAKANILIHPVVGMTKPGDIDHFTRVRCYQALMPHYPDGGAMLSLLPLAMRMGGPREAVWHAIIRKNYGCTHFIVGRDHAGPGKDSQGKAFYGPYDAQEMVKENAEELGIKMVPFRMVVYVESQKAYVPMDQVPEGLKTSNVSGTQLRSFLEEGTKIPEWFSYPEVIEELEKSNKPLAKRGFSIFFTGLSGSGKSTLANILVTKLLEKGGRAVTLLDGDVVRKNLSSELGFSKEHRSINVRRIGYVASEIVKNGGAAICAPIAPYEKDRNFNRQLVSEQGGYFEIYVSTPLSICEGRDPKGMYAKARKGLVKSFTGIDDPYEVPKNPALSIDTTNLEPGACVDKILALLEDKGFLG